MIVDKRLNDQLDSWIREQEPRMIADVIDLLAIVSLRKEATAQYPFGEPCAEALDHALALARSYGFPTENNEYYYGSCLLKGSKSEQELGIICHLDIVSAEGEGWKRPPFEGYVENGYIVGRGSTDNKGPLVAALYVLRFLKEHNIQLKNDIRLVFGCDEESGSADMAYYRKTAARLPAFSLVPDGPFPVCYAEKGRIAFAASADLTGGNLLSFTAGDAPNSTPSFARAEVSGVAARDIAAKLPADGSIAVEAADGFVVVTAKGLSKHTSTPQGAIDAVHLLATFLSEHNFLTAPANAVVKALASFTADYYGEALGIAVEDEILGKLTHSCSVIRTENDKLTLSCDVRYPIRTTWERMRENIRTSVEKAGYALDSIDNNAPNYMPAESPVIQHLCALANEQMGTELPPATMGGGTYARTLPNAVGYGPSRPEIKKPFPDGHGWAHQANEGVRIQNLIDQIRIYVPALMYLDENATLSN